MISFDVWFDVWEANWPLRAGLGQHSASTAGSHKSGPIAGGLMY
jgi:hypothetical protein